MYQYAIYQMPEDHKNIRDLSFMSAKEIEAISDEYEFVAAVKAKTLDHVFRIGNFVVKEDRELIAIIGDMRSVSVGDIIECIETGETVVVANYGFDKIQMKEAV